MPYSYTKLLQNLNITDALLQNLGFHSHFAEFVFRGRPFTEFVSRTPCRISYFRVALLQNFTDTFQQNSYFTDGLLQNSHFADALQISYFAVALLQNSYFSDVFCSRPKAVNYPWTQTYWQWVNQQCSALRLVPVRFNCELSFAVIISLQQRRENSLLQGQLSVLTLISVSVPPPRYRSST